MKTVEATPEASMLIESMRDIGYSLETALADIIDNSITAQANTIQVFAEPSEGSLRIAVLDDGIGMTETELFSAMRPGSRNPLDARPATDLGRFGLGLKTASFSQCRKLTVVSRRGGKSCAAIWDLDFVAEENQWLVQIPDDTTQVAWADQLGVSGTLVLWEKLDRISEPTDKLITNFVRRMDEAREHLELVFHRFLSGERGLKKISVLLNNRPLEPFDPFHSNHPATIAQPSTPEIIKVGNNEVSIQTFTLPHHRKVTAPEWDRYAGRAGYLKNQGFYVYRQKRLIIHGTWFGLARQTELTKLCRVRIDMPNGLDAEWKIDVKKASAQPPHQVRDRLRRLIETIGATSRRVYTSRGRILVTDERLPVWNRQQDKGEITYRLNALHPMIKDFKAKLSGGMASSFNQIVELVEAAFPVDALFADFGGAPEKINNNMVSEETLDQTITTTLDLLRQSGIELRVACDMFKVTEPFRSNWELTEKIIEKHYSGELRSDGQSHQP